MSPYKERDQNGCLSCITLILAFPFIYLLDRLGIWEQTDSLEIAQLLNTSPQLLVDSRPSSNPRLQ